MDDKTPALSKLSVEQLLAEVARRSIGEEIGLLAMEEADVALGQRVRASALEARLSALEASETDSPEPCPTCGRRARVNRRKRVRTLRTLSGTCEYRRNYHYCGHCRSGWYPLDRRLGLPERGELSPALERRILDFGIHDTFESAAERWSVHYPQPLSENLVRLVVERVGQHAESCDREELECALRTPAPGPAELLVVGVDGSMLPMRGPEPWREVKLATVYRGENLVHRGRRGRIGNARYVATLGNKAAFGEELAAALRAEQADTSHQAVWVGDGAAWIWNLADELLPEAHQVLDWWHVAEHVAECAAALFPNRCCRELWRRRLEHHIWTGDLEFIFWELEQCMDDPQVTTVELDALEALLRYLESHQDRLNYQLFRDVGFPVGSGFIESAHRHVLQVRMKRTGQRWAVNRGRRMARLRAALSTTGPRRFYEALTCTPRRKAA